MRLSKRRRLPVDYRERSEPEETPLMARLSDPLLPGELLLSNMCFAEDRARLRRAGPGLVATVTEAIPFGAAPKRDFEVLHRPFADSVHEPEVEVAAALHAVVERVHAFWSKGPPAAARPVLVHCSAGQNRSAAVALAVLRSYGVEPDVALQKVLQSARRSGDPAEPWEADGWEKFVGPSGERLLRIAQSLD